MIPGFCVKKKKACACTGKQKIQHECTENPLDHSFLVSMKETNSSELVLNKKASRSKS